MESTNELEAACYSAFQCTGAACEDTCCEGWGVFVDEVTYHKYQNCSDSELGPKLRELVTILPTATPFMYASMPSPGGRCSFLEGGLCSIQKRLGAEYLSQTVPAIRALSIRGVNGANGRLIYLARKLRGLPY